MFAKIAFIPSRASQLARGNAEPLPVKCSEGYRIADFPHYPGWVMQVVPNFGESDLACDLLLAAIAEYAWVHRPVVPCDARLAFHEAVSASTCFPTRIVPPSEPAA